MKPGSPSLDCAGDVVEVRMEDEIAERPCNNLFVWNGLKIVLLYDCIPNLSLVRHVFRERNRNRISYSHLEHLCDTRPHVLPAEVVPVRNIEDLVLRCLTHACPRGGASEYLGGSDLVESLIGFYGSRKAQRETQFFGN